MFINNSFPLCICWCFWIARTTHFIIIVRYLIVVISEQKSVWIFMNDVKTVIFLVCHWCQNNYHSNIVCYASKAFDCSSFKLIKCRWCSLSFYRHLKSCDKTTILWLDRKRKTIFLQYSCMSCFNMNLFFFSSFVFLFEVHISVSHIETGFHDNPIIFKTVHR